MVRISVSWPVAVVVGLALLTLSGCAAGSAGWSESHEDWLRSASGPFPDSGYSGNGSGGGGSRGGHSAGGHR